MEQHTVTQCLQVCNEPLESDCSWNSRVLNIPGSSFAFYMQDPSANSRGKKSEEIFKLVKLGIVLSPETPCWLGPQEKQVTHIRILNVTPDRTSLWHHFSCILRITFPLGGCQQKARASLRKAANPLRTFTHSYWFKKKKEKKRSLISWKTGGVAFGAKEQEKDNCYWNISTGLSAPGFQVPSWELMQQQGGWIQDI